MTTSVQRRRPGVIALACALAALCVATPAAAGPPYMTDDPEPTDTGHWEIYAFGTGVRTPGETEGETGLDINYGAAKDVQLTLVVPAEFESGDGAHAGRGEVEAAAKFRFLHQETEGLDLAFFPAVSLQTASRRFSGKTNLFLPLWGSKDFGEWTVFGGGGYQFNAGPGNRDYWTGGLALTRNITERLSVGGEVYGHTRDEDDGKSFVGFNLGVTYKLNDHWSLLAAGGPGLVNARQEGQGDIYIALKADY